MNVSFRVSKKRPLERAFEKKNEFTEETTNVLPIFDYIPAKIYRNIDFFGPKKNHPQPASVQFVLNLRILLKQINYLCSRNLKCTAISFLKTVRYQIIIAIGSSDGVTNSFSMNLQKLLKFIYSEKATKFCTIFTFTFVLGAIFILRKGVLRRF